MQEPILESTSEKAPIPAERFTFMARLNDAVARIRDARVRAEVEEALQELLKKKRFGLVFEEHVPETTLVQTLPVRQGSLVVRRDDPDATTVYRVMSIDDGTGLLTPEGGGPQVSLGIPDLVSVKPFGEPIFPGLTSTGRIQRGPVDRPFHAVMNAENYHALQLFLFMYEGQVDCIYIDPPYNTGARDWKYNNRFVDSNDVWRHSKWLSMMEKRLRLSRRLLRPDGVLVVTIDENEHAHLVMLLESVFKGYAITSVAIVHNPRGVQGDNFSYNNEFAVFVIPSGAKVIAQRRLTEEEKKTNTSNLRNWGGESERTDARNCFYPIYVKGESVVGFGDVASDEYHPAGANVRKADGRVEVWPIDEKGIERKWRYARQSVDEVRAQLIVTTGRDHSLNIHIAKETGPFKTVWQDKRLDASVYGTQLVKEFTGTEFPFPKSLYAVYEVLYAVTVLRPNALILDFFAGSGTTLHATWLLNTLDGGKRRCILVTNNEVEDKTARALIQSGSYPGSPSFEANGIFEKVTIPRVTAALAGRRPDGAAAEGKYKGGDERSYSSGFEENLEFFRLDYLDSELVDLGSQFEAIFPILWLTAGGVGSRGPTPTSAAFFIPEDSHFGVLLHDSQFPRFRRALEKRSDVTHVWLVTNSPEGFADMRAALPSHLSVRMLYRDYLRNFRLNVEAPK
ncbi:MAG: site-specific DNA-methyltransferase [Nitrososphaerota archaeon]|nr:site-specific DNA-methyltransferase [Nitrososphaerota archaeon]